MHGFTYTNGTFVSIDYPGARSTDVYEINNAGQIAGRYEDETGTHNFFATNGVFTRVDYPGARVSEIETLNDAGEIAGDYVIDLGLSFTNAFLLSEGSYTPIHYPGAQYTNISDFNNAGQIVGSYDDATGRNSFVADQRIAAQLEDTFRFFDTRDGGHFFTNSEAERDQVLATRADLKLEGVGFQSFADDRVAGAEEVYRFFSTRDGGHFFTTSEAERDQVLATRADLKFEGVGFYEFETDQGEDTSAVYRFFDTRDGGHFFTASETERDQVLATRADLTFEGIAFYAPNQGAEFLI